MRKPIIAANWKMNKTNAEAREFLKEFKKICPLHEGVEVVICPPFTALATVAEECKETAIEVGAQNVHWQDKGAFTGEISPLMLKELGVSYCIIGHSERRYKFFETDKMVNLKINAVLNHGLKAILCVGETLEEREQGITFDVCRSQIKKALDGITAYQMENVVIAYEPIWAIGTGKTASPRDAQEVIATIRETLENLFGMIAQRVRIQYGGSVKPDNIKDLMNEEDIDGALVGGASLKPKDFSEIVGFSSQS